VRGRDGDLLDLVVDDHGKARDRHVDQRYRRLAGSLRRSGSERLIRPGFTERLRHGAKVAISPTATRISAIATVICRTVANHRLRLLGITSVVPA
jgi:hypothetical protein